MKLPNFIRTHWILLFFAACLAGCSKKEQAALLLDTSLSFTVNDSYNGTLSYSGLVGKPLVKVNFTEAVDPASVTAAIKLSDPSNLSVALSTTLQNDNKTLLISPLNNLSSFTSYTLSISAALKTATGGKLINPVSISLITGLDDTDKFPRITDDELLTLVQKQTFRYFWDFGHPASGMARERNTSGDIVTSGGSGFGIMAILVGISRNFISKAEGLARIQKIVGFLKTADRFHGAFPHWMNGNTGKVIPFSVKDNGGDLVETSFLMQGLLSARQYFNGSDAAETTIRSDINKLYNEIEWSWYQKNNSNTLYWHWSPDHNWDLNLPLRGWNEALITYVLAASSPTFPIPKSVYDIGWANNGLIKNGSAYFGFTLPMGIANGGPLFFEHYSFLGINPIGLTDAYANYETQTKNHTLINRAYCISNPKSFSGYGADCWGLTASDVSGGYSASSPTNDVGVIAPTAALSSFPYTPAESMQALKFFYHKLGNKTWGEYGFYDSFNLSTSWFASSTLAIDQGPIIVMIENHRTKLLWSLFMSCPEVKAGMRNLGFSGPNL